MTYSRIIKMLNWLKKTENEVSFAQWQRSWEATRYHPELHLLYYEDPRMTELGERREFLWITFGRDPLILNWTVLFIYLFL